MPDYFNSSLTGQQIEDRLLGAVLFNGAQTMTSSQKEQARANIGAGAESSSFKILGFFDTLEDLEDWLQVLPSPGDAYGIGASEPYDIYVWDGVNSEWVNNGSFSTGLYIDDNDISHNTTWSSYKINNDITAIGNKQDTITAVGMLKGAGSGVVGAAVKGTDYAAMAFTVTLSAINWSGSTQTISNANFVASGYAYTVAPAGTSFSEYATCEIYADDVTTDGQMTFHCSTAASNDLTVNIIRAVVA